MTTATIEINGRTIGTGHPTYIIAEMSANHNRDLETAKKIVHAAKEAGADALKIQTYDADSLTIDCDEEPFQISSGTLWDGQNLYQLYNEAYMPWEWHEELQALTHELGLDFFSTPTDVRGIELLEKLNVPVFKLPSFEIVDLGLLERLAQTGKPVILSTGMSTFEEVQEAAETLRNAGCSQFALLKCNSSYPAPPAEMNLRTIPDLAASFNVPVGLSDHTFGTTAAVASIALGGSIIEKHLTLDRNIPTADAAFSLEPAEFKEMVDAVRTTEAALGTVSYGATDAEQKSTIFRRSLFAIADIAAGEQLTTENIRSIRPGSGLAPRHLKELLGKKANVAIKRGTPLSWNLVD